MRDTGFPWADAENDFQRARRRQVLATLAHRLRRQPPGSDQLLRLDEVTGALGWRGERQLGLRTIRLDTIAGTVDSGHDFDRHFRPASGRVRVSPQLFQCTTWSTGRRLGSAQRPWAG